VRVWVSNEGVGLWDVMEVVDTFGPVEGNGGLVRGAGFMHSGRSEAVTSSYHMVHSCDFPCEPCLGALIVLGLHAP
jgi:hypothetical protein